MRALSFVLILANALFLVWAQLIDVNIHPLERAVPVSASPPPRIVLAREAPSTAAAQRTVVSASAAGQAAQPTAGDTAPAATQADVATATQPARPKITDCTTVGPFADLSEASQAQAALRTAGFAPRQRLEQGELWVGYWVSVQNLTSRDAADSALRTLNDNGISDIYIMPADGGTANILSLGVFSDYGRAQRRANEVRALGLEPRIDDRKRSGSVYWIDVDITDPSQGIDTSTFQTGPGKIMRLELRACPKAG